MNFLSLRSLPTNEGERESKIVSFEVDFEVEYGRCVLRSMLKKSEVGASAAGKSCQPHAQKSSVLNALLCASHPPNKCSVVWQEITHCSSNLWTIPTRFSADTSCWFCSFQEMCVSYWFYGSQCVQSSFSSEGQSRRQESVDSRVRKQRGDGWDRHVGYRSSDEKVMGSSWPREDSGKRG